MSYTITTKSPITKAQPIINYNTMSEAVQEEVVETPVPEAPKVDEKPVGEPVQE